MSSKVERFFKWENFASVETLANDFGKSKRRIQQVIAELDTLGLIERGILVLDLGLFTAHERQVGIDVKPVYRRIKK